MKRVVTVFIVASSLLFSCTIDENNDSDGLSVKSIEFDKTEIRSFVNREIALIVTVFPQEAAEAKLRWSSSNNTVATVNNGIVRTLKEGTVTITVSADDNKVKASCSLTISAIPKGAVDLGLGVCWATCNIGASSPEGFGEYFSWGETSEKDSYVQATYKWYNSSTESFIKYNFTGLLGPEDDVATKRLGEKWHTPTYEELEELVQHCTMSWVEGKGEMLTSKVSGFESNSIFIPAAGFMDDSVPWRAEAHPYLPGTVASFWTSNIPSEYYDEPINHIRAGHFYNGDTNIWWSSYSKFDGLQVRPVVKP